MVYYFVITQSTSSSNSESSLGTSSKHLCLAWPIFGMTRSQRSQRRKRASKPVLRIPSGLNSSETNERTSVLEASDCMLEDEDGLRGGLIPEARIFQVGTRWVLGTLSFLFFADAVDGSVWSGSSQSNFIPYSPRVPHLCPDRLQWDSR